METTRNRLITFLIIVRRISFVVIIVLLFFSKAIALEVSNNDISNNALKNNISFRDTINNSREDSTQGIVLPVDILKELQDITKKQNISLEEINIATDVLKNRNAIKTFFVGNNLGTLKFQLVQIGDQIYLLDALVLKTNNNKIQTQINNQAKLLREEKIKVEDFILKQDNKFSLFGWLVVAL